MNDNSNQENLILKKRLNTCRSSNGRLNGIPDDLTLDIIKAWERWPGNAKSFYQTLGLKKQQLACVIKKGKRLLKEGKEKLGPFTPIEIKNSTDQQKAPIVLIWDKKRLIRFYQVSQLVEFLKEAA